MSSASRGDCPSGSSTGAPTSLREIGMPEAGLERAAELAMRNPYWNPRDFDQGDILALLRDAYHGARPAG